MGTLAGSLNNEYSNVAFIVLGDAQGNLTRCSGTLLSPTVVLTAAHCIKSTRLDPGTGATFALVGFDPQIIPDPNTIFQNAIPGQPFAHPGFTGFDTIPNPNSGAIIPPANYFDVGVVYLSQPVIIDPNAYGMLPEIGAIDDYEGSPGLSVYDIVGYGRSQFDPPQEPTALDDLTRYFSNVKGNALEHNLRLLGNLGKNTEAGNLCFGDSGGPAFFQETNTVVAVASFSSPNCIGAGYSYRIDNADSLDFITGFLEDPQLQIASLSEESIVEGTSATGLSSELEIFPVDSEFNVSQFQESQSTPESTPVAGILALGILGVITTVAGRER